MAKRRNFTPEFKAQVVLSVLTGRKEPVEICREHDLHLNVVNRWKREFIEGAAAVFETSHTEHKELAERIAELERMVGRLTMENEILKKASDLLSLSSKRSGRL